MVETGQISADQVYFCKLIKFPKMVNFCLVRQSFNFQRNAGTFQMIFLYLQITFISKNNRQKEEFVLKLNFAMP